MSTAAPRSVSIERSGGLAGMKASVELDGAALTPAQQAALATLARRASTRSAPPPPGAADGFSYRVQVTGADGTRSSFSVSDDQMPDALAALCKPKMP